MNQLSNPFFSRMLEGKISIEMPANSSFINHSLNSHLYRKKINQGYSLKCVLAGAEKYSVGGKHFPVEAYKYLTVAHGSEITVEIDAKQPVEGFCFFLSTALVQDVWYTLHASSDALLENNATNLVLPDFYENMFDGRHDPLGGKLFYLVNSLKSGRLSPTSLNEEIFYEVADALCRQQSQVQAHLATLKTQKKATAEELYRRLLFVRDYMHDQYGQPLGLSELAATAAISEYHFVRSFKTAFRLSPYQYLLQLRLQKAKEMLQQGDQLISDVAFSCGFNEVQAFRKLFRKEMGSSPSSFMRLPGK